MTTKTMNRSWTIYESPLGALTLEARDGRLTSVSFPGSGPERDDHAHEATDLSGAERQLDEYFAGNRKSFELDLALGGTELQRTVWSELQRIPYGTTVSYGELARKVGHADRVRAVAGAVARTPTPIVVPCHRVIGADGSLTGYLGGLERKQALLDLERGVVPLLQ